MKNIKQKILSIAIAIVLVMFIAYGINTFFKSPKYEDYCNITPYPYSQNITEQQCTSSGGKWNPNVYEKPVPVAAGETVPAGYCDQTYTCNNEFTVANEKYNRLVFIISGILGLICVIIGGVALTMESVSAGIMGGGILTIIYGTLRYWGNLEDVGRFIALGIILTVLIFIGYKYLKKP